MDLMDVIVLLLILNIHVMSQTLGALHSIYMLVSDVPHLEVGDSMILPNLHLRMILIFAKKNAKSQDQNVLLSKFSMMLKIRQVHVDLEVVNQMLKKTYGKMIREIVMKLYQDLLKMELVFMKIQNIVQYILYIQVTHAQEVVPIYSENIHLKTFKIVKINVQVMVMLVQVSDK